MTVVGLLQPGEMGAEVCRRSEILLSICPSHAALDVAGDANGFTGVHVDANAIAPDTARAVAELQPRLIGGGIVGPPPAEPSTTRPGWRRVGEMEEIAHSMAARDLPTGFHEAAAQAFRRTPEES